MPIELPDAAINEIVPKLAMGVVKLGFQKYRITKKGQSEILASSREAKDTDIDVEVRK
jgi:hypothetical protein